MEYNEGIDCAKSTETRKTKSLLTPNQNISMTEKSCCQTCHADVQQIGVNNQHPWCALQGQCPCHTKNKNTLSELIEQEMERFGDIFSREWFTGFGTTTDIDAQGIDSIKSFLKSFALTIAKAIEKAGDVEDRTGGKGHCKHNGECRDSASGIFCTEWEESLCDDPAWNANNAERHRRLQAWFGEEV